MRTRSWWLFTAALALFILAAAWLVVRPWLHAAPTRAPAAGWWPPPGTVIGVQARFRLRPPRPVRGAAALRRDLIVPPGVAPRLQADAHGVWTVAPPPGGWPADRPLHLAVAVAGRRAADTVHVDPDRTIVVNLTHQLMQVYQGARLVRTMSVSTGAPPRWTTPTGTFWIFRRVRWDHMRGGTPGTPDSWDVTGIPFSQYIVGGIAIHGAYWNRRFGVPVSHGCIQLPTRAHNPHPAGVPEDAGWLWRWAHLGDPVIVTGSTPGPPETPLPYPRTGAGHWPATAASSARRTPGAGG